MASWEEVAKIAEALPEVAESTSYGNRDWKVRKKTFAWHRPLRQKERERLEGELGDVPPDEEILAVRVPDEEAKLALLESEPRIYFTTPHFDGHPSVLVRLGRIPRADLEEALVEAWLAQAPQRLADAYLDARAG
jgi:hypothetical protein